MASKSKKARPAAAKASVPAVPELGPLPPGFVWSLDEDGCHAMRPTPARAVSDLLTILTRVKPWERYPEDAAKWTTSQVRARLYPMPGRVIVGGREVPASDLQPAVATLREYFLLDLAADPNPEVRVNPIDERKELVLAARTAFAVFVPAAIDAVLAAGGRAEPLRELERDPELCSDTVTAAVTELQKVPQSAAQALAEPSVASVRTATPETEVADLDPDERTTLEALRARSLRTDALDGRGSSKRARARLVLRGLIEACGPGVTKRGVYRLTASGHAIR